MSIFPSDKRDALLSSLPVLNELGLSDEEIAVKVFSTYGVGPFRTFIKSVKIDELAGIDVPWDIPIGSSRTSMISFIVSTGAYTTDELLAKYKPGLLKKAVRTILNNTGRFGGRVSTAWPLGKKLGVDLTRYYGRKFIDELAAGTRSAAGRGVALADMLFDIYTAIGGPTAVSICSMINPDEAMRMVDHHHVALPMTDGARDDNPINYKSSTALWLTERCGTPYFSHGLKIWYNANGDRAGFSLVPLEISNLEAYRRWGRMCIETYGVSVVYSYYVDTAEHVKSIESDVMEYFYGANDIKEDTI